MPEIESEWWYDRKLFKCVGFVEKKHGRGGTIKSTVKNRRHLLPISKDTHVAVVSWPLGLPTFGMFFDASLASLCNWKGHKAWKDWVDECQDHQGLRFY